MNKSVAKELYKLAEALANDPSEIKPRYKLLKKNYKAANQPLPYARVGLKINTDKALQEKKNESGV